MHEPTTVTFLRWIVLLPLAGAIINALAGALIQRSLGKRWIGAIGCGVVFAAFGFSVWTFHELLVRAPADRVLVDRLFTWLDIGGLRADVAFQADPLSAVMILVVTGVGGLIHLYSTGYMHEDRAYWRYFAFLNLFTFAMLTLVLADNLLLMFVGWEGVGLCSYALIGFWYTDWEKASAGTKAFIVNRIGDFGFMVGTFLLFWAMWEVKQPTLTFRLLAEHAHLLEGHMFWGVSTVTLIALLMFVGAAGKSAQIPLYVWLPDAMAGPTPVSALIHAATMVTAGVYMIGRMNFLYSMSPTALTVVATVGAVTAFFAATIGLAQNDIKKVLAYSTVSQLGYMFLAMGSAAYAAGIFHLTTHAFFKGCLFLGAGSVIHAMHHEQDMRKMGGLVRYLPYTYITFLISTVAIAGIFPTAGFFSKDEILWKAYSSGHIILWGLGLAGSVMTAFYMFRQVFMTFHGDFRGDLHRREHLHESPLVMTVPLMVLAALALLAGVLGVPPAMGGANRFEEWLAPVMAGAHGAGQVVHHGEDFTVERGLMVLSVTVAILGIFVASRMYLSRKWSPDKVSQLGGGVLYRWVYNKYYVDELYQVVFVGGLLWLTRLSARFDLRVIDRIVDGAARVTTLISGLNRLFDDYVVDGAVNGVARVTGYFGAWARRLQMGSINGYLYVIILAVVGVMVARLL
jgi:NADH-quinone oxidoreductase subunit L